MIEYYWGEESLEEKPQRERGKMRTKRILFHIFTVVLFCALTCIVALAITKKTSSCPRCAIGIGAQGGLARGIETPASHDLQVPTPAVPARPAVQEETRGCPITITVEVVEESEEVAEETEERSALEPQVDHACRCGDDCKCPHEIICKNGHCRKSYAIVFSTDPCYHCVRMYPVIEALRKDGYAVYLFHSKKYAKVVKEYGVQSYPTVVFFRNGKEVLRRIGYTVRDTFERYLDATT